MKSKSEHKKVFTKEKYADGTCVLVKRASSDNNSDVGTKRVTKQVFEKLTNEIVDKSLRIIKVKNSDKMSK